MEYRAPCHLFSTANTRTFRVTKWPRLIQWNIRILSRGSIQSRFSEFVFICGEIKHQFNLYYSHPGAKIVGVTKTFI